MSADVQADGVRHGISCYGYISCYDLKHEDPVAALRDRDLHLPERANRRNGIVVLGDTKKNR